MRRHASRVDTTPRGSAATPAPNNAVEPTEPQIRARAYAKYLARGQNSGDALTDWLDAERELCQETKNSTRPSDAAKTAVVASDAPLMRRSPTGDLLGRTAIAGVDSEC